MCTAVAIRSLKKEPKMYFWDWSEVDDKNKRFENIIASHLLKFCHYLYDVKGVQAELYYLRDVDGHEVDFLVTVDRKPWFAVEVKANHKTPSRNLFYFNERLNIPFLYQVVQKKDIFYVQDKVTVVSADIFLAALV